MPKYTNDFADAIHNGYENVNPSYAFQCEIVLRKNDIYHNGEISDILERLREYGSIQILEVEELHHSDERAL